MPFSRSSTSILAMSCMSWSPFSRKQEGHGTALHSRWVTDPVSFFASWSSQLNAVIAVTIEGRLLLWMQHNCGEGLFDDCRPGDELSGAQARAVVDGARDEAAIEECPAATLGAGTAGGAADCR